MSPSSEQSGGFKEVKLTALETEIIARKSNKKFIFCLFDIESGTIFKN